MMKVEETALPGVFILRPRVIADARGSFTKLLNASFFAERGLHSDFRESYYSVSAANVLRGLHFQVPPADGAKLVACLSGTAQDVLLDLRKSSPAYGRHVMIRLRGEEGAMVYMPAGVAHGFWVEAAPCGMLYYQAAEYAPAADRGIRWDTCDIAWPCRAPLISERDAAFPSLVEFDSPFV